jgi:hypothetical protein
VRYTTHESEDAYMQKTITTARSRRGRWAVAAAAVAALGLAPFAASPAQAAEVAPAPEMKTESTLGLTADQVREAHADFQAAGIPFDVVEDAYGMVNVYHFPEGDFGLRVPADPDEVTTKIGVGSDADGQYISLNHTDQLAIKNGSVAALTVAITALNPAAGAAVAVVTAVAGTYVSDNGMCPGNDELWIYYTDGPTGPAYSQVICRPVSYPGGG